MAYHIGHCSGCGAGIGIDEDGPSRQYCPECAEKNEKREREERDPKQRHSCQRHSFSYAEAMAFGISED
jgi:predicted RNA-binding Zn-ribbon protein involved in translation (DUF1610 family)